MERLSDITLSVSVGEGKFKVKLDIHTTKGNGLSGFLSGGELPHLGGTVLATPGILLHGKMLSSCDEWLVTVPGHKDTGIAQFVARKICIATSEPVSISAGVHVDNATQDEIKILWDNCSDAANLFLDKYLNE